MKLLPLTALGLTVAITAAPAAQPAPLAPVPNNVLYMLSAIETLPTREQLLEALTPGSPLSTLLSLISSTDTQVTVTVRLRSIRAIGQLRDSTAAPGNPAVRAALTSLLDQFKVQRSGTGIFYLIATIESLGSVGSEEELPLLLQQLTHPSRDVQIAVVRALRRLALPQAANALRDHYVSPTTHDAVKIEISETLQLLEPQAR